MKYKIDLEIESDNKLLLKEIIESFDKSIEITKYEIKLIEDEEGE